jgi:hypothetical protein
MRNGCAANSPTNSGQTVLLNHQLIILEFHKLSTRNLASIGSTEQFLPHNCFGRTLPLS